MAWNVFSSLYFKAGGIPWSPKGLAQGTCYVGISFFRPLGEATTLCISLAQAFNEYGDGLVLRGQDFLWDAKAHGSSPHLSHDQAKTLINQVLKQYRATVKQQPRRVVIHKSSRFWPAEREGFQGNYSGLLLLDLPKEREPAKVQL